VKAARLVAFGDTPAFELVSLPDPSPSDDEVVVALRSASLNRRDPWIWRQPGYCRLPVTLGSDGAGVVEAVGGEVSGIAVGDEVVLYPAFGWRDGENIATPDWEILGAPSDGTFAEKVVLPAANVVPKPPRLSWYEAATLGVAGLTAWRATVTCGRVGADSVVLVTGAGSGVSTFALQIAVAHGAAVYVTSSTPRKIDRAVALGARGGFSYRSDSWMEEALAAAGRGFDIVIDGYGAAVWTPALRALRDGGVLVTYGDTGPPEAAVNVMDVYWHWRSVVGTSMGSPCEFRALLDHVAAVTWLPAIDSVFALEELAAAAERLESRERFGKVVLAIG
jgi:NADPH:quinone reductase-like Zn-dependent oxidoreductase